MKPQIEKPTFKEGGKCPYCGDGKIVKRVGKWGEFLGCDLYQHTGCMFVAKIDQSETKSSLELQADEILRSNNKEYLII